MSVANTPSPTSPTSNPAPTGGGAQKTPVQPGAFSMAPIKGQARARYLNLLVYGPSGIGKSTLLGSASNLDATSDVLVLSPEGGDLIFEENPRIRRPELIDFVRIMRIEQLQKVYEWTASHVRARDANDEVVLRKLQNIVFFGAQHRDTPIADLKGLANETYGSEWDYERLRRFRTVGIDSLTEVEAQNMDHVLGANTDGVFEIGADIEAPEYKHYRKNNMAIQGISRSFKNLNVHLIIICGQKYSQDEQKKYHYTLALTGQLTNQIMSQMDVTGYMVASSADLANRPDLRRMYVQPQAAVRFDAKTRIASLTTPYFDDPTFEDVLKAAKFIK